MQHVGVNRAIPRFAATELHLTVAAVLGMIALTTLSIHLSLPPLTRSQLFCIISNAIFKYSNIFMWQTVRLVQACMAGARYPCSEEMHDNGVCVADIQG